MARRFSFARVSLPHLRVARVAAVIVRVFGQLPAYLATLSVRFSPVQRRPGSLAHVLLLAVALLAVGVLLCSAAFPPHRNCHIAPRPLIRTAAVNRGVHDR